MFCIVGAVALLAATTAGILIIRRQLGPLARVSAAARQVADLELDRGEVRLPTPIVKVDPAGAHTEIGQLGSALNRMLDRIAGALSARHASEMRVRQFVADASHELRTPLAAIRGYTELAQRKQDELPDDVAHAMSRVESETERMTHLVEDMLLLARLDTGRPLRARTGRPDPARRRRRQRRPHRGPRPPVVAGPARRAGRGAGRRGAAAPGAGQPARQCADAHSAGHVGDHVAGRRRRAARCSPWPTTGRESRCGCSPRSSSGSRAATRRGPGAAAAPASGLAIVAAVVQGAPRHHRRAQRAGQDRIRGEAAGRLTAKPQRRQIRHLAGSSRIESVTLVLPPSRPASSRRSGRRARELASASRACGAGVLLVGTAVLYLWNLSASGWANSFYSAAAQAGAEQLDGDAVRLERRRQRHHRRQDARRRCGSWTSRCASSG